MFIELGAEGQRPVSGRSRAKRMLVTQDPVLGPLWREEASFSVLNLQLVQALALVEDPPSYGQATVFPEQVGEAQARADLVSVENRILIPAQTEVEGQRGRRSVGIGKIRRVLLTIETAVENGWPQCQAAPEWP